MEREQVKRILIFYRDIDSEISYIEKLLCEYEDKYYTQSSGSNDINRGIKAKGSTSNPTENIAINIPDSVSCLMHDLQTRVEQLTDLKTAVIKEINRLILFQKSILYDFYILGLQWVRISAQLNYSVTQCKKIRNKGLDNLAKYFDKNELIKNFNYPC